jgi:2-polyprenyl-6-methoxyphenol hydroxylase-like FAD-dependent oxidoreductase
LRTGGYIVDFWGAGFEVAERMGIVPTLLARGYPMKEVRQVDRDGERVSGFAVSVFDKITHGRFTSIARSDLARSIVESLGDVETLFDDTIEAIEDVGSGVRVEFEKTPARDFDLVVGADGLHSRVRGLVFGEEARFEKFLGLKVAAFAVSGYRPRDELVYVMHTEIGQQVGRFTMRDDQTLFLFVFKDRDPRLPEDFAGQKALLQERFSGSGWECSRILGAIPSRVFTWIE